VQLTGEEGQKKNSVFSMQMYDNGKMYILVLYQCCNLQRWCE
jgi:hypothetical protein